MLTYVYPVGLKAPTADRLQWILYRSNGVARWDKSMTRVDVHIGLLRVNAAQRTSFKRILLQVHPDKLVSRYTPGSQEQRSFTQARAANLDSLKALNNYLDCADTQHIDGPLYLDFYVDTTSSNVLRERHQNLCAESRYCIFLTVLLLEVILVFSETRLDLNDVK